VQVPAFHGFLGMSHTNIRAIKKDDRKWARLQIAVPVFVRSRDENGKDSLEFATAVNISRGGALVVVRRSLPKSAVISLEIPSAPIGPVPGLKSSTRAMHAKTVWVSHLDGYHMLGLRFAKPLGCDELGSAGRRLRKQPTEV
jgi:hypothetical protein